MMTFTEAALDRMNLLGRPVPSSKSIDEEIIDLQSAFPDAAAHLPQVFEEAVTSSIGKLLDQKDARSLMRLLRGTDLGNPEDVYSTIDRLCPKGGSLVKGEIAAEFSAKVRRLFTLVIGSHVDSAELADMSASLGKRLGV